MAWRLRLVPVETNIDFFKLQWVTFGASIVAVVVSILAVAIMGLNFGVDFKGGTTIRTESTQAVDVGVYREAMTGLGLGDVAITQVFDPTFREDQHVAMGRIEAQEGEEAITPETIAAIEGALRAVDPAITFPSVESVGPKVSSELIWAARWVGPSWLLVALTFRSKGFPEASTMAPLLRIRERHSRCMWPAFLQYRHLRSPLILRAGNLLLKGGLP